MASQLDSPLLGLAPELRDKIYTELMASNVFAMGSKSTPDCYGLLLACKQTYHETIQMYYSDSTFTISSIGTEGGVDWLANLSDDRRDSISDILYKRLVSAEVKRDWENYSACVSEEKFEALLLRSFHQLLSKEGIVLRKGVLRAGIEYS